MNNRNVLDWLADVHFFSSSWESQNKTWQISWQLKQLKITSNEWNGAYMKINQNVFHANITPDTQLTDCPCSRAITLFVSMSHLFPSSILSTSAEACWTMENTNTQFGHGFYKTEDTTGDCTRIYYHGQKNRYSREIHELDLRLDRVMSGFGSTSTRPAKPPCRELAFQIEVDVAWYHIIALRINLMNISAVTNFLARVVSTDWCSETGSLTSLVACNSGTSQWRQRTSFT